MLKSNPDACRDFLAFCQEAQQECYCRVLDGDERNIDYLKGKRDTYLILERSMAEGDSAQQVEQAQLELDKIMSQAYIKW